jgi:hypothetical protein
VKVAVLGVGTAGIMSLCHALRWLCPKDSTVTSIYDPNFPILGIGETSQPGFQTLLFESTGFTFLDDADKLDATIKLGGHWKNWRANDFNACLTAPSYAIHFNNFKLKDFCFSRFNKKYQSKFLVVEGNIDSVTNVKNYVSVIVNGIEYQYDYVIDCRGYPTDWTDYYVVENPTVNSALVNIIKEPGTWTATINQATKNGWMFGLPLQTRQGWGYLYNDKLTTKEEAVADIKEIFNKENLDLKEFKFTSYHANTFFDGRILKNGNRAFFFEPIEGQAGFFYEVALRYLVDYVYGQCSITDVNNNLLDAAKDLELFINFIYHGGSKYQTSYWDYISTITKEKLHNSNKWKYIVLTVNSYLKNGGQEPPSHTIGRWSVHHWKMWSNKLGYNYFYDKNI